VYTWHSFSIKTEKPDYEQFLEIAYSRLCRMEMGRWLSWIYCCILYCLLVIGLLLKIFPTQYKLIRDHGGQGGDRSFARYGLYKET
jgi:hypothetical protein